MRRSTEIILINRTKQRIPSRQFFSRIVKKTLQVLKEKERVIVSFVFVSPAEIKTLNKYWRKKNKEALVLSFPLRESSFPPDPSGKLLGDIFLCPKLIKERKINTSLSKSYQQLIVHSLLHLYGYTHQREKDSKEMEELENKIINYKY